MSVRFPYTACQRQRCRQNFQLPPQVLHPPGQVRHLLFPLPLLLREILSLFLLLLFVIARQFFQCAQQYLRPFRLFALEIARYWFHGTEVK